MSEEFIIDYVPSLEDNHHMDEIRDFSMMRVFLMRKMTRYMVYFI